MTQGERLAKVEARLDTLQPKVDEIHADVKTLLAAHNRQKGMAKLGFIVWSGVVAISSAIAGAYSMRPHA